VGGVGYPGQVGGQSFPGQAYPAGSSSGFGQPFGQGQSMGTPGYGQAGQFGGSAGNYPGMQTGGFGGQPGTYPGGPGGYSGQQPPYGQFGQKPGQFGGSAGNFPGMQSGGFVGQPGLQGQTGMGGVAGQSVFQTPTTFQVRRNFFFAGGEMDILLNGVPHFRCVSMPSPLGYGVVFSLMDTMNNQLCCIQPDQSYGTSQFNIFVRGTLFARLKQDWCPSEKKFEVHNLLTGEQLKVYGDWFGQNFEFQRRHGQQVAQVTSGYGTGDLYEVTVYPGEDALFILSSTLCIEKLCHEHKHHHKHNW